MSDQDRIPMADDLTVALSAAGQAKQPTTELQTFDAFDSSSLSKNL